MLHSSGRRSRAEEEEQWERRSRVEIEFDATVTAIARTEWFRDSITMMRMDGHGHKWERGFWELWALVVPPRSEGERAGRRPGSIM